jgi:hypothetical protein
MSILSTPIESKNTERTEKLKKHVKPKGDPHKLSMWIDRDLFLQLKILTTERQITITEILTDFITQYVSKAKRKDSV